MINNQLTKSEKKVTEVISFILEQYRNENINHNIEVCSELILIARILHQRMRKSWGGKVKEYDSVELAKKEILKEIKDDQYYGLIKDFIKDYQKYRNKNLN